MLLFQQWLYKNCRKKLILKIEIPLKNIATRMHDDPFTKHILDYLQRIIYNRRENVSSKNFFFQNVEHSISYIIFRKIILKILLQMNLLQNNLFEKRAERGFWAILAKIF